MRGLERVASTVLKNRRENIKTNIAEIARQSRFISNVILNEKDQNLSQAATLFARIVGHSDALVSEAHGAVDDEVNQEDSLCWQRG